MCARVCCGENTQHAALFHIADSKRGFAVALHIKAGTHGVQVCVQADKQASTQAGTQAGKQAGRQAHLSSCLRANDCLTSSYLLKAKKIAQHRRLLLQDTCLLWVCLLLGDEVRQQLEQLILT